MLPTRAVVLIAVLTGTTGLCAGVVLGRAWGDAAERARARAQQEQLATLRAVRRADKVAAHTASPPPLLDPTARRLPARPVELARVQAGLHCAFTLRFDPASVPEGTGPMLLGLRVEDAYVDPAARTLGELAAPVGEGWTYRASGFRAGDTAVVVVPFTQCATTIVGGYQAGVTAPPPPIRVIPR